VSFEKTTFNRLPYRFEAGTPNIAGVIGLASAIDYIEGVGLTRADEWESELLRMATERLQDMPGVTIVGTAKEKTSVLSFVLKDIHPHDIGTILDKAGVAIRAGHHCAQPVMDRYGVAATARASFSIYNTPSEIDTLVQSIRDVQEMFGNV
jgi:cysteine desulfurase/selenocysteine lyase